MILSWDKPKKARPTEEHNERFQSDTGVPGTFVSNMSEEDENKWKAKLVNKNNSFAHVEIRRKMGWSNVLIIVGLNGWNYSYDKTREFEGVRVSANGPWRMSMDEVLDFNKAVNEAYRVLQENMKRLEEKKK